MSLEGPWFPDPALTPPWRHRRGPLSAPTAASQHSARSLLTLSLHSLAQTRPVESSPPELSCVLPPLTPTGLQGHSFWLLGPRCLPPSLWGPPHQPPLDQCSAGLPNKGDPAPEAFSVRSPLPAPWRVGDVSMTGGLGFGVGQGS